jgi:hypothetical protein
MEVRRMKLNIGDIIKGIMSHNDKVTRQITEVRKTGYTWKYPDIDDRDFWSENSNDPFFEWGWEIVKEDTL